MHSFKIMLDSKTYKEKPNNEDVRNINRRVMYGATNVDVMTLSNEILTGKSFCPAYISEKKLLDGKGNPRRSIQNWTSQQVICLDFDNETNKIKDVRMTIPEAIDEFRYHAAFIYKSFSHTEDHPKFRVVFILDKPIMDYVEYDTIITALLEKYPHADQQCKDGSRIFYGGKEVIEIDYSNVLRCSIVDDAYNSKSVIFQGLNGAEGGFLVPVRSKVFKSYSNRDTKTPSDILEINNTKVEVMSDNISLIRSMNIEQLQQVLGIDDEVTFYTYDEVYEYLKSQDLNRFLGLYGNKFKCSFHEDIEPSANIYKNVNTGDYMYKCFSDNCKFKNGTIMKCVERILNCNKVEGIRFLRKVFKINYHETNWQKEQREILDENIRYIRSEDFYNEYPIQYKLIKPYLEDLHMFLVLAKDNLPPEHYTEEQKMPIFYTTLKQFATLRGYKDHRRLTDRLALFAYLCYVYKLNVEQTPDKLLKQAKRELMKNKSDKQVMNISSFFSIPSYSENIMSAAEEYAEKYYDHSLTMSNWGWEMLFRTFGKEEADRVYPQLSRKKLGEVNHEHVKRIEIVINSMIEDRGYAIEDEVVDTVSFEFGGNTYKKKQLKICIGELLDKYGLVRVRLNKKLKEKYMYEGNGYPYVICKM